MKLAVGVPKGYTQMDNVTAVFISDNDDLVILGEPEDEGDHNCDYMGCSSVEHVIFRCKIDSPFVGW